MQFGLEHIGNLCYKVPNLLPSQTRQRCRRQAPPTPKERRLTTMGLCLTNMLSACEVDGVGVIVVGMLFNAVRPHEIIVYGWKTPTTYTHAGLGAHSREGMGSRPKPAAVWESAYALEPKRSGDSSISYHPTAEERPRKASERARRHRKRYHPE